MILMGSARYTGRLIKWDRLGTKKIKAREKISRTRLLILCPLKIIGIEFIFLYIAETVTNVHYKPRVYKKTDKSFPVHDIFLPGTVVNSISKLVIFGEYYLYFYNFAKNTADMDRRDFFKKSMGAGLLAGSYLAFGRLDPLLAGSFSPGAYDLVAVKGGEPEVMFEKAILSMGGMQSFIKKGQKVVVKPNIGWDVIPENAANTNPKLVAAIIRQCLGAGAKDVYVFDNTCDNWTKTYKNSGIEKAVKDAGGKMVPGNAEKYYHKVDINTGKSLKSAAVHELILQSDIFINVPILKHHGSGGITVSMKNLMGVVWDRSYWHRNNLHQCIADFATWSKPTLNIVDAYRVMLKNGPRGVAGEDISDMRTLIISRDMVAADAAAAKLFGIEPESIGYIKIADEMKVGTKNLGKLNINRIKL
jgi:uncharacterized protein (DUF362 family)